MKKKNLIVLTGAGMSAESGIKTFRDAGGLWEGHDVMEVASPEGWVKNPALVLDFYNQRRRQLADVKPNKAHLYLASLQEQYHVQIITQNIDDLHERAGSQHIVHLHGEIGKARSIASQYLTIDIGYNDIKLGDLSEDGYQLRPHIVWFGEEVPNMDEAMLLTAQADILVVIGTSLQVYPAAGLLHYAPKAVPKAFLDPNAAGLMAQSNIHCISNTAVEGIQALDQFLKSVE